MSSRYFKLLSLLFLIAANGFAQNKADEAHITVALRMIGHQVLLHSGDSTSRVLPVEKVGDRYKLQFTTEFQFDPDDLVKLVDSVVYKSGIAQNYLVEIKDCTTTDIVYSYEIGDSGRSDIVPCKGRVQPKGCYALFFAILETEPSHSLASTTAENQILKDKEVIGYSKVAILSLSLIVLIGGVAVYFRKRATKPAHESSLIRIGQYQFDTRNMKLHYKGEENELTSKEADLLLLLHTSANSTVERDRILKEVWGDEGDYIGRTLDVFISKLRKKLEGDSRLKIVNVRGVGYKLILNG